MVNVSGSVNSNHNHDPAASFFSRGLLLVSYDIQLSHFVS